MGNKGIDYTGIMFPSCRLRTSKIIGFGKSKVRCTALGLATDKLGLVRYPSSGVGVVSRTPAHAPK